MFHCEGERKHMIESILNRRSTRRFSQEPISDEHLQALLNAAMQAPSEKNEQPWEFLVITDPDVRLQLSKADPYAGAAKNAPTVLVLLCNKPAYLPQDDTFWQQDMAAAAENILLAAQSLKLGAVWLALAPLQERIDYVSQALTLPEGVVPFAMIPVGHPLQEKTPENRYDSKRVFFGTYG